MKTSHLSYADHTLECHHQGAHLSAWTYKNKQQLFLSKHAIVQDGVALRGGVPICFPQFAAFGPGNKHGFARNVDWRLIAEGNNKLQFALARTNTHPDSSFSFNAVYTVEVTGSELLMRLEVENSDQQSFEFTSALHTYFKVEDVNQIKIAGLEQCRYWENGTDFSVRKTQGEKPLEINSAIDRVYFNSPGSIVLEEPEQSRIISATGFNDVVVWNPWQEGAEKLNDMANNEYLEMVCIEAANVDKPISINPGDSWLGEQCIKIIE